MDSVHQADGIHAEAVETRVCVVDDPLAGVVVGELRVKHLRREEDVLPGNARRTDFLADGLFVTVRLGGVDVSLACFEAIRTLAAHSSGSVLRYVPRPDSGTDGSANMSR